MLFGELPLERRFDAAASAGFAAVEHGNPYLLPAHRIAQLVRDAGLELVLINTPPGPEGTTAAMGWGCLPGTASQFRASVERAVEYAVELGRPFVHVRAGLVPDAMRRGNAFEIFVDRMLWAAERAAEADVRLTVEAFNPVDVPGYLLNAEERAAAVVREVGSDRIGLQLDVFHCHRSGRSSASALQLQRDVVVHVQVADVPGRGEPGTGTIDFAAVWSALDDIRYGGWIGCEYAPRGGTVEGLGWRADLAPR